MSDNKKMRMGLYIAAGVYLLYTAWQLFQGLSETEENPQVFAVFALLFAVGGVALIGFAIWNLYKQGKETGDSGQEAMTPPEDGASERVNTEDDVIVEGDGGTIFPGREAVESMEEGEPEKE